MNSKKFLRLYDKYQFCLYTKIKKHIVNKFHRLYYGFDKLPRTWTNTYWLGTEIYKCPLDMWIYQEIIFEIKPDLIIECGTAKGGGSLYLSSICTLLNKGRIITIDIEECERPKNERIKYLLGSSTSKEIIKKVEEEIKGNNTVMVILDSDHTKNHVFNELKIYSEFVTKGSYLIVEDTNINGHPVFPSFGPGPMEALEVFLKGNKDFIIDKNKEKFLLTFNPSGYLRKIK